MRHLQPADSIFYPLSMMSVIMQYLGDNFSPNITRNKSSGCDTQHFVPYPKYLGINEHYESFFDQIFLYDIFLAVLDVVELIPSVS